MNPKLRERAPELRHTVGCLTAAGGVDTHNPCESFGTATKLVYDGRVKRAVGRTDTSTTLTLPD